MRGPRRRQTGQYKPFGDATKIIDFERTLHIFIEPSVQAWTQNMHWLMDAADWIYLNGHFFVTLAALVFIYLRRNDSFYFVRNMLMIAMAIALIGYCAVPDGAAAADAGVGLHRLDLAVPHRRNGWSTTGRRRRSSTSTRRSRRCTSASR